MNLLEIRTELVKRSGRFDLVVDTTDYVDNGADLLINAGQRWLDRKIKADKSIGRVFTTVATGAHYVTFKSCRVIEEVWAADTTDRKKLLKVDMEDLRGIDYASQIEGFINPYSDIDQGRPLYWAPANLRTVPNQTAEGFDVIDGFGNYMDVTLGSSYTYNGIVFLPPSDGTYMIEVVGRFLSDELSVDADVSYWSEENPDILLMAGFREIEIFNRNSEGVKDWTVSIMDKLVDMDKDLADEESNGYDVMEG